MPRWPGAYALVEITDGGRSVTVHGSGLGVPLYWARTAAAIAWCSRRGHWPP